MKSGDLLFAWIQNLMSHDICKKFLVLHWPNFYVLLPSISVWQRIDMRFQFPQPLTFSNVSSTQVLWLFNKIVINALYLANYNSTHWCFTVCAARTALLQHVQCVLCIDWNLHIANSRRYNFPWMHRLVKAPLPSTWYTFPQLKGFFNESMRRLRQASTVC